MKSVAHHLNLRRQLALACAFALAACSANPPKTEEASGAEPETTAAEDAKSTLKSIGADIGCGIATIARKDCAKGAAAGSRVADKVLSWVFRSLKIADGKTVNKEYEEKKVPVSKNDVRPMAFTTRVQTTDTPPSEAGSKDTAQPITAKPAASTAEVKITSNTDLVGYGDKVPVVTQKYALYDEKNKLVSTQTEKVAAVDGAGRYETEARVKIPKTKGKDKQYRVETTLMVNGKEYKKNSYDVAVFDDGGIRFAAIAGSSAL